MVETIAENLEKGKYLLENISDKEYTDKSLPPFYSSIGGHMRHVLDVFKCVFNGLELNQPIDLTLRERNILAETTVKGGLNYIHRMIEGLHQLNQVDMNREVTIIDDLGKGKQKVKSTLGAILFQAHSHAIHHFATIGYMMHALKITLPIDRFGVNPTTPQSQLTSIRR